MEDGRWKMEDGRWFVDELAGGSDATRIAEPEAPGTGRPEACPTTWEPENLAIGIICKKLPQSGKK